MLALAPGEGFQDNRRPAWFRHFQIRDECAMETETFTVKNVKCGGCVANVQKGLKELAGVEEVEVTIEGGQVTVKGHGLSRAQIAARLNELGYPEA